MNTYNGDIWDLVSPTAAIVITTNGVCKSGGQAVMGAGLALQAAQRYPALPFELGAALCRAGNKVYWWPAWNVITFPTKHHWRENSDPDLIEAGAFDLLAMRETLKAAGITEIAVPKLGCNLGRLRWEHVKPILLRVWEPSEFLNTITFVE